ncbi:chorismate mutase [Arenibaculum pallidiluteum]|uniref:chorismate mutase n=1 Tax=Arenibaculum pallidiluteum TaxID=2812559 RepID=UPI001A95DD5C|nr:chorismate mutase [Arenibaculum pallidiluteum]
MVGTKQKLDELRREVDEIDDAIHDLLMRRGEVYGRIAELDGPRPLRPAREAMILRRLVSRHAGPFPTVALVQIWREMFSAHSRLEGPFAVAVHVRGELDGAWDVTREHFGGSTPLIAVNSPAAALRAVSDGSATVAVVPFPEDEDPDPWWRFLMSADPKMPHVVARLPFHPHDPTPGGAPDLLALAAIPHEPTGDDRTLLGLELVGDVSRGRLKEVLEASGMSCLGLRSWLARSGEASLHMAEVAGFIDKKDPRLAALAKVLGGALSRATPIGGYAVPLPLGSKH